MGTPLDRFCIEVVGFGKVCSNGPKKILYKQTFASRLYNVSYKVGLNKNVLGSACRPPYSSLDSDSKARKEFESLLCSLLLLN